MATPHQQPRGRKRKQELKPRNEPEIEIMQMDLSPIDFAREQRSRSRSSNSSHSNISNRVAKTEIVEEKLNQKQVQQQQQEPQKQQQQQQQQPEQAENLIMEDYNDDDMIMEEKPNVDELQREILRQQTANEQEMFARHHQQQKQVVAAAAAAASPVLLTQAPMAKTVSLTPILKLVSASKLFPTLPVGTSTQSLLKKSNSLTTVAALATQTKAAIQAVAASQIKAAAQTKAAASTESSSISSTVATTVLHDEQRQSIKDVETIEKDFYLSKPEIHDALDLQETDTDEDGQSELHFGRDDFFADNDVDGDEIEDDYNPIWSNIQPPRRLVFQFHTDTSHLGLKGRHPKFIASPLYYFNMMLRTRKEFFSKLTYNCNVYGKQLADANQIPLFLPVNNTEIQFFIGLCLQMSQLKLPTIAEYFCDEKSKFHYGFKGFNDKMSEQRFLYILRCISFNYLFVANSNDYDIESLRGLKSLVAYFNKRMEELYVCDQRIIIKDPLVFWKGQFRRLSDMSDKFRLNAVHLHHCTVNNGLILKILPEIQTIENKLIKKDSRRLVEMRINMVLQMLKDKLNQGHTVYVSKYYTSYALAWELATRSTYCTGFLDRKRYGNSKALLLSSMEPKSCQTRYAHSVLMGKYCKNEKSQYFLSSDCLAIHPTEMIRKKNDSRPKIITELDFQMNFSKHLQSYLEEYQLNLQKGEMKWEKTFIIYILNLMVFNAYVLYKTNAASSSIARGISKLLTYPEFRKEIIFSLLQEDFVLPTSTSSSASSSTGASSTSQPSSSSNNNRRGVVGDTSRPTTTLNDLIKQENDDEFTSLKDEEHFPMTKTNDAGKYLMKKCRICYMQIAFISNTKYFCNLCPGQPGLCEEPCFKIWHNNFISKKKEKSSLF